MSSIMTSSSRRSRDHFEPSDSDPQEQRKLRATIRRWAKTLREAGHPIPEE